MPSGEVETKWAVSFRNPAAVPMVIRHRTITVTLPTLLTVRWKPACSSGGHNVGAQLPKLMTYLLPRR
jgi:hypothetical protein